MTEPVIDYTTWDWLPRAAVEVEAYIHRLLEEGSIRAHDVSARAKSIASFQRKCEEKKYDDPIRDMTDVVAVRIITYSTKDREGAGDLIRERFVVKDGEDRNPGDEKDASVRGYDSDHLVVDGERDDVEGGSWMTANGKLQRYFKEFGGLEIQIRTVAGHAWAEFEHSKRYKNTVFKALDPDDQDAINKHFIDAADLRRMLDKKFMEIEACLASPSRSDEPQPAIERKEINEGGTPLAPKSLETFLKSRFPDDTTGSELGIEFGVKLVDACGLKTIEALESTLDQVDSLQVSNLMDTGGPVTQVRRMDDELLAGFGEDYIERTKGIGYGNREDLLKRRFDRLRGKYKA